MRSEVVICPTRLGIGPLASALAFWLGLVIAPASLLAAPINGEDQLEPTESLTLQDPTTPALEPSFEGGANATVIEFTIVPSARDPNKTETVIIVQQKGGRNICVDQNSSDIISRGYRVPGGGPFDPNLLSEIRGLSSGDSGTLVGFNDITVFIKPYSSADEFIDPDECFKAAEIEACFVASVADCGLALQEGDFICVGDTISSSGCPVVDHTNLIRQLRIMVTLNQPFGDTPLITEAGLAAATQMTLPNGEFGVPGGQSSRRSTRFGPIDGGSITGGGSANLVVVPNIIGLTLAQASPIIAGVGLALGVVTIQNTQTGSLVPSIIRSAYAQHCQSDTILTQTPAAGTLVSPGTQITVVLCGQDAQGAAVSEPPSLILFAAGLGLLILFTWSRRRLG